MRCVGVEELLFLPFRAYEQGELMDLHGVSQVPLMSIISEAYFTHVDTLWDYVGQIGTLPHLPSSSTTPSYLPSLPFLPSSAISSHFAESAFRKGTALFTSGCLLSEFGSRRRRTYRSHDLCIRGLIASSTSAVEQGLPGKLAGTSNVHFAMKYDLNPIGTIAHEFIMGIAALEGYEGCNGRAMDQWE